MTPEHNNIAQSSYKNRDTNKDINLISILRMIGSIYLLNITGEVMNPFYGIPWRNVYIH